VINASPPARRSTRKKPAEMRVFCFCSVHVCPLTSIDCYLHPDPAINNAKGAAVHTIRPNVPDRSPGR
jgi:hypothetical protein